MNSLRPEVKQRKRWYGTQRWKRLRMSVLTGSPNCSICHVRPATQADHVQHRQDNATFWDETNLRPACAECNNRVGAAARHARQGGYGENRDWGAATAHGDKERDTGPTNVDRAADLFQQLKEKQNAKSDDK
jgi:5-methylcytosine-specific restriction endonuclease McrA